MFWLRNKKIMFLYALLSKVLCCHSGVLCFHSIYRTCFTLSLYFFTQSIRLFHSIHLTFLFDSSISLYHTINTAFSLNLQDFSLNLQDFSLNLQDLFTQSTRPFHSIYKTFSLNLQPRTKSNYNKISFP